MFISSIVAYAHFVAIISLGFCLISELIMFKPIMSKQEVQTLAKVDLFYGLASILVAITGVGRMFHFGKGSDYYLQSEVFISKMILFGIVGALSIYPTIRFIKARNSVKTSNELEFTNFSFIKTLILIEIAIYALIPLFGAMLARGVRLF